MSGWTEWWSTYPPVAPEPSPAWAESLIYTDDTNKVIGPLAYTTGHAEALTMWVFDGVTQRYTQDYTVREVVGGSAPGWYICIGTTSSAPGGGTWNGGSNPGTGINGTLAAGDDVRVMYLR